MTRKRAQVEPRELAAQIVADRLAWLSEDPLSFLGHDGTDHRGAELDALRDAIVEDYGKGGAARVRAFLAKVDTKTADGEAVSALLQALPHAGFLLGLEFGRRLGGAR